MSNSKNYTITSLSSSLNQLSKRVFSAATNSRLREGYAPYTVVKSLKGDVENKEDFPVFPFGRFGPVAAASPAIPESITEGESLAHWYKMDEGSTSAVTDVGLNASSTDMALVGVSSAGETGPSAIGSPDAIQFDGATGVGSVFARTGGANTPLGDLFNTNTYSVSWWMKDTATPTGTYKNWISMACYDCPGWPWIGWGVRYYYANFYPWQSRVTLGTYAGGFSTGSWRHYTLTFDSSANLWEFWINGSKTGYNNGTLDTFPDLVSDDMYLSIAGIRWPSGAASQFQGANDPYYSDLRFYDIVLSDANIASIYAGDWT